MSFSEVLSYSCLAGISMFGGTLLVLCYSSWVRKNSVFLISFAAGVMLTIAFANLMPHAAVINNLAWRWAFLGFLILYVVQNIIMFHPCHGEKCETHDIGTFSLIGLTAHSLLDGVIVVVGFEADWRIGLFTTIAVLLHKLPDGISLTSILLHSGASTKKTIFLSSAVAFATPIGSVISYFFLRQIGRPMIGTLLAVTAGFFIYLAAADLLPETHKVRHRANALFFFLGIAVILILENFLHL